MHVGEVDDRTIEMMNRPRCGVSDKLGTNRLVRRKKRYALQGMGQVSTKYQVLKSTFTKIHIYIHEIKCRI